MVFNITGRLTANGGATRAATASATASAAASATATASASTLSLIHISEPTRPY